MQPSILKSTIFSTLLHDIIKSDNSNEFKPILETYGSKLLHPTFFIYDSTQLYKDSLITSIFNHQSVNCFATFAQFHAEKRLMPISRQGTYALPPIHRTYDLMFSTLNSFINNPHQKTETLLILARDIGWKCKKFNPASTQAYLYENELFSSISEPFPALINLGYIQPSDALRLIQCVRNAVPGGGWTARISTSVIADLENAALMVSHSGQSNLATIPHCL